MARPRELRVLHKAPTEEEERLGSVFECTGCDPPRRWPLRFKHSREKLCVNCGRDLNRARKEARRQGASMPPVPQARAIDLGDGRVEVVDAPYVTSPEANAAADRKVAAATRPRKKAPSTGLVRR